MRVQNVKILQLGYEVLLNADDKLMALVLADELQFLNLLESETAD